MQGEADESTAAIRRADLDGAKLPADEHALMKLVELLTLYAYRCQDEDVQKLRDVGWTDPQIAEAVYITAMFAFFTRVADAFGLEEPPVEQLSHIREQKPLPKGEG